MVRQPNFWRSKAFWIAPALLQACVLSLPFFFSSPTDLNYWQSFLVAAFSAQNVQFAWLMCLPLVSGLLGLTLARWLATRSGLTAENQSEGGISFKFCFCLTWTVLFGYAGFFHFAVNLGGLPLPTNDQEAVARISSAFEQLPMAMFLSLLVSFATAVGAWSILNEIANSLSTRKHATEEHESALIRGKS